MVNAPKQLAAKAVTRNVNGSNKLSGSYFYFWAFVAVTCLVFWAPIKNLITFSLAHDYASHVLLIAPLSIFLIYLRRHEIFSVQVDSSRRTTIITGSGLFLLGVSFLLASKYQPLSAEKLSLEILSLVVLWFSVFNFCYGSESLIKARFPLLFLLLLV